MIGEIVTMSIESNNDNWTIKTDGIYHDLVAKQLKLVDDFPDDTIPTIFQNAIDVLSQCPNPNNNNPERKTGLIIGKVQSGKTSNFLSIIALAFDNNYDITIVFGGTTNDLRDQNLIRIREYFGEYDTKNLSILSSADTTLLTAKSIDGLLHTGKKILIVALKHSKHINQIKGVFENTAYPNLGKTATLIVDDEGDQATPNTKKPGEDTSTTYQSINDLRNALSRHCFISVTATPQANILIPTIDQLSPDFGQLIYPGIGYCGLQTFHGDEYDTYLRKIPDSDVKTLLEKNQIPDSLKEALASFFVGGAIRLYRNGGDPKKEYKHSMLIHPDVQTIYHKKIVDKIEDLLDDKWKTLIKDASVGDTQATKILDSYFMKAYDDYKNHGVVLPEYSDLKKSIYQGVEECHIHECNSNTNSSKDADQFAYNIFVGGNILARGITLPKLSVSYITRQPKGVSNIDNTEQRARWFGYRDSYIDVCRVYATTSIQDNFADILEHEDALWDDIQKATNAGYKFKDIARILKVPVNMRPTRVSVAPTKRVDYSAWNIQGYVSPKEHARSNTDLIEEFRNTHSGDIEELNYNTDNIHKILKNLNFDEVFQCILSKYIYPNDSTLDREFILGLDSVLNKLEKPLVDIVWIRDGRVEQRGADTKTSKISQLFQGSSNKKNIHNVSQYYPGDRYLDLDEHNIQIQIHKVQLVEKGHGSRSRIPLMDYSSPILALHLPIRILDMASNFIIPKGVDG